MIKLVKKLFSRIQKWDVICILVLLVVTLFTRIVLISSAPFFYAQDAFRYLGEAMDFAYNGTIEFKVDIPFIFVLGVFVRIFGPFFGEIFASRLVMSLASALMIIILYKFGQKMSCRLLGVLAGLLAVFEPYSLKYSTVPYLEVFAISTGLIALYLTLSGQKLQTVLAPIFFYIALLTRPELGLSLVIPIVIAYFYKNWKIRSKQKITGVLCPFFFTFIVYLLPFIPIYFYVQSWGVFGLAQRITLFLTPELLSTTVNSSFRFYDQQLLNQVICLSVLTILGLSLLKTFLHASFNRNEKKIKILVQSKMCKNAFFSDGRMTAFCLFLLSIIYIFVLTIFSYGYNWAFHVAPSDMTNISVLKEAVIIAPSLHDRYLILLRLLISFPLAYPLVVLARKVWIAIVHKKRAVFASLIIFLTVLSSLYTWHSMSMWQSGLTYSKDASTSMGTFVEASGWLSERLGQDEIAVVPSIEVFLVLNPELSDRLVDYKSLWNSAGIAFHERSSPKKLQRLHNYFNDFVKENPKVKYLVRDWVDPYARYLFEKNDALASFLKEVKTIPFTLCTGWSNKITIYEQVQYATLFAMELSSPPKEFHTIPPDVLVQYDSDGATIHKADPRVGFYLPLEEGINTSKQNYLTMQIKPDVENLELTLVFYYDRNRDGRWSGYEIDYVKSATFSQSKLGWVVGEWYTIYQVIPQAEDPAVQIGIILAGDVEGTFTLSNLVVYTEAE